jgi:hypothetical protein
VPLQVKEIASTVRKLYDAAKKSVTTTASAGAAPKRKKWIAKCDSRSLLCCCLASVTGFRGVIPQFEHKACRCVPDSCDVEPLT